jgi:hypothetical protein
MTLTPKAFVKAWKQSYFCPAFALLLKNDLFLKDSTSAMPLQTLCCAFGLLVKRFLPCNRLASFFVLQNIAWLTVEHLTYCFQGIKPYAFCLACF